MDLSDFYANNLESKVIGKKDIDNILKDEPCCLGIDEAGRGPVLGPMVYGICFCPISKKDELKEFGCADSKALTEEKREAILDSIVECNFIGWIIHVLSPTFISNSMLALNKYNLNSISHDSAIGLIQRALDNGANIKEVFVDTVGPPEKYQEKLKLIFPNIDITVAKKADATYPIVSAASIFAKVSRDLIVKNWQFSENLDMEENNFGSGYPGDPLTKKFLSSTLDNVFGFPQLVRFSWSTADKILEEKAAKVTWPDDDIDENKVSNPSVLSFFSPKNDNMKKHNFFNERKLMQVCSF